MSTPRKVPPHTPAECLPGVGSWEEGPGSEVRGRGRKRVMRRWGQVPWTSLATVASGSTSVSARPLLLDQSLLWASQSPHCAGSARRRTARRCQRPWAEPQKSPPAGDHPQVLPGDVGRRPSATGNWFLEIGPQGPGEPRSVPVEGGSDLPLDPVSAPCLGGQRPGTGPPGIACLCLTVSPRSLMK